MYRTSRHAGYQQYDLEVDIQRLNKYMEDGSQPEYAFAGGERDTSSIIRLDLSVHMSSEEERVGAEARSRVSMALLLSSFESTILGLEDLTRAEMRKERGGG
jgi:hypothetical protein